MNWSVATRRRGVTVAIAAMSLSASGCASFVRSALQAAVGEAVEAVAADDSPYGGDDVEVRKPMDVDLEPSSARPSASEASVYLAGPVPGWQTNPLLFGSGSGSPYYRATFFRGHCPSLFSIALGRDRDPFGEVERAPLSPFDMGNTLGISPDYSRFGRVQLGGFGTPHGAWRPSTLLSQFGDRCGVVGVRLISFGEDRVDLLHR